MTYEKLLPNVGFNFNLRRHYTKAAETNLPTSLANIKKYTLAKRFKKAGLVAGLTLVLIQLNLSVSECLRGMV